MNKIDTSSWKEFRVGDLFDIHPTKHYGLANAELFATEGKTPVIVNSAYENGVGGYVDLDPTEKGGIITFSDTTDANSVFYQPNDFIGYSHVQGMYPKFEKQSDEVMQYIASVFKAKALTMGYNYSNKFRRDVASEITILLPVKEVYEPDWQYMEEYMREIEAKASNKLSKLEYANTVKKKKIDVSGWEKYTIEQLFDVLKGRAKLSNANLSDDGTVPVYSSTTENNGIFGYTNIPAEYVTNNEIPFYLVFGDHTKSMFIAEDSFNTMDNVKVLVPHKFNEYAVRFITTQWYASIPDIGYARHWSVAQKSEFYLPTKNGEPDWDYMEQYMRKVHEGGAFVLRTLTSVL